jgi:hypothetical protein
MQWQSPARNREPKMKVPVKISNIDAVTLMSKAEVYSPVVQVTHMASGVESANAIWSGSLPFTALATRGFVGSMSWLPVRSDASNFMVLGANGPSRVEGTLATSSKRATNAQQQQQQQKIPEAASNPLPPLVHLFMAEFP